jgi:MFS family permease
VIAGIVGLAFGPSILTVFAFGTFIAPLDQEFGWGVPAISLGASIITLLIVVLSPVQGALVDRFGGRRVVLTSIPLFAAALMSMSMLNGGVSSFYLAWVGVLICGIGLLPVSYNGLTTGWFDRRLGFALGVTNSGIGIGAVLAPVAAALLIAKFGWRGGYLGLGIIALLVLPVAYFLIVEPAPRTAHVATTGDTVRAAARSRTFWVSVGAFFLLGLVSQATVVHQSRLLIDAGNAPEVANLMPAVLGIALIIARIATGWLLDRFRVSRVMPLFLIGGAIAALLYASGPSPAVAVLAAVLTGLLIGAEFDVLAYLVPRYFGRRAFGQIYGINYAAFNIAGAIAIYAAGASRAALGSYTPLMLVLAGVCLLCAVFFLVLGPYRYQAKRH